MATYTVTGIGSGAADPLGSYPTTAKANFYLTRTGLVDGVALVTSDVLKCITIPAKTLVLAVALRVVTAAGTATTATFSVGDTAATTTWVTTLATTVATTTNATMALGATPKFYEVADSINLVGISITGGSGVLTTGLVELSVTMIPSAA